MNLTAEQARFVADFALATFEHEREITKRVIAAIPASGLAYSPDPKSMKALDLAWHLASADWFFLNSVLEGKFAGGDSNRPDSVKSVQDVLNWYDQNVPPLAARVKALSDAQLAQSIDFFGMMQAPAAWYLSLMIRHGVHHRGQLSAYLRPMGAKVPSIYGPSADTQTTAAS
jgi:uncharacterized damage-inducible protein DinB